MEKPCGGTEITDELPACGAEIEARGSLSWSTAGVGDGRDEEGELVAERKMSRTWREARDSERERERIVVVVRRSENERSENGFSQSDSDPALLSRHANSTTAG